MCTTCQDELVYVLKCSPADLSRLAEPQQESKSPTTINNNRRLNLPGQIIYHIMDVYEKSLHGARITSMQHVIYDFESAEMAKRMFHNDEQLAGNVAQDDENENDENSSNNKWLLGNKENAGFLYFPPTRFHATALANLLDASLTQDTYLIGLLIQRWEIPWAKLFPLRLYLRLGEQFECNQLSF